MSLLRRYEKDLAEIFIVSQVTLADAPVAGAVSGVEIPELNVKAERSTYAKCQRCWNLRPSVGAVKAHPDLCDRCSEVVGG